MEEQRSSFMIRRARLKMEGHTLVPWLAWRFQYDWSQPVMRDFSLDVTKLSWLRLQVGRRKVMWNDERVTSSGNQQFVNRSILNDIFTIDRQQGIQVYGRLLPGTAGDLSYSAGVFTGVGVGSRENDDQNMMYAGRLQWNPLGQEVEYSQSDVEFHAQPAASLVVGAARNISRCTAYETDANSCRLLPTLRSDLTPFASPAEAVPGQFELQQLFFEFRLKWRGLYAKYELHLKRVIDRTVAEGAPGRETDLHGSLYQAGYFPHHLLSAIPEALEVGARYAWVNGALNVSNDFQTELSGVINWFFSGHANKVSFEVSRLSVSDPVSFVTATQNRVRTQWDVSF